MARMATRATALSVLLGAAPALVACGAVGTTAADTSGTLPSFGWPSPRMRAPSTERPAWLRSLPEDLQRQPAPGDGFRA